MMSIILYNSEIVLGLLIQAYLELVTNLDGDV